MKKLLLTLIFIFIPFVCHGATLNWTANTESDLAGYKVYTGIATGVYDSSIDVGNVISYELGDITDLLTHYYAVTAYDTSGNESGFSNEVSYLYLDTAPPNAPTNVIIILQ